MYLPKTVGSEENKQNTFIQRNIPMHVGFYSMFCFPACELQLLG